MCHAGDRKGDDEIRDQDDALKSAAFGQLDELKSEYERMTADDGFFAKQMENIVNESTSKSEQVRDNFNLVRSQQNRTFDVNKTQSAVNYQQQLNESRQTIENLIKKSQIESVAARDATGVDVYGMMMQEGVSGIESTGGRARIMLQRKKASSTDAITLGLKQAKEQADQNIANAEISRDKDVTASALSMQNATETAELNMRQTQQDLERKLNQDILDLNEKEAKLLSTTKSQGMGIKSSTIQSFRDQYSRWDNDGNENTSDSGDNKWHNVVQNVDSGNSWEKKIEE